MSPNVLFGPVTIDAQDRVRVVVLLGSSQVDVDLEDPEIVASAKALRWVAERAAVEQLRGWLQELDSA